MFDPDDIRRSGRQKRPPWEVGPADRLWDFFSHPDKDDPGTEFFTHTLGAEQNQSDFQDTGSAPDVPPPTDRDPRGKRYTYPTASSAVRSALYRERSNLRGALIIVAVALIFSIVGVLFNTVATGELSPEPEISSDWDIPEEAEDWPDYGDTWGDVVPDGDTEDSAEEASAPSELERAELTPHLAVELHSADGLPQLSYQALYAKCLPSTVSITVINDEGIGTGTGIIMTEDGYLLTCNHVIEGGKTCRVTTSDDQTYPALLVGGDAQTDLAILKIEAEGLTPAQFGNSDELTVGDEALAIGDPLGTELRGTLTNGIISAINRNVTVNSYSMTLLQTTAALNSGNSGGPLINIYGQVIGVNNMKMNSNVVTVEGLGFAVPTSVVQEIVPVLAAQGKVSRPVLGITCYGIDEQTMEQNDEPTTGLRVASVNEASDAYAQGLQVGDYITAVNGVHAVSVADVKEIIADLAIGDTVELEIFRIDEETEAEDTFTLTVALVDQSDLS